VYKTTYSLNPTKIASSNSSLIINQNQILATNIKYNNLLWNKRGKIVRLRPMEEAFYFPFIIIKFNYFKTIQESGYIYKGKDSHNKLTIHSACQSHLIVAEASQLSKSSTVHHNLN
jgi:hypothetical protein